MFLAIEEGIAHGVEVSSGIIFEAINVTIISPIYGILIFLWSLLLWFVASIMIEKKLTN